MSYARFGVDGSSVYVFKSVGDREHPGGWLECCYCHLPEVGRANFRALSTAEMVDHLAAHVAAGQRVPASVVPKLERDDAENFPQQVRTESRRDAR